MDPYLEHPNIWKKVHLQLIIEIQMFLAPRLHPNYYIDVEELTYLTLNPSSNGYTAEENLVGIPDGLILPAYDYQSSVGYIPQVATKQKVATKPAIVQLPTVDEVKHRYLTIRRYASKRIVTMIEILSPVNKINTDGRQRYTKKRNKIIASCTNLVEIDLLRAGKPLPMHTNLESDYRILISRAWQRPTAELYMFSVREMIPDFPIPVDEDETEPILELNNILHDLYFVIGYGYRLRYHKPPVPNLNKKDRVWAETLIEEYF